jgi:hypothetical protein
MQQPTTNPRLDRTVVLLELAEDDLRYLWRHAMSDPSDRSITAIVDASRSVHQALRHLERAGVPQFSDVVDLTSVDLTLVHEDGSLGF